MLLQEMIDILEGMINYLPGRNTCIALAAVIVLLGWRNFRLGMLGVVAFASYLFIRSFLSTGDVYSLSIPRIGAGLIIGISLLFLNIYFIASLIGTWEE